MSRGPLAFSVVVMEIDGKTSPLMPPWGGHNPVRFYKHEARAWVSRYHKGLEGLPWRRGVRVNSVVNVVLKGMPNGD